MRECAGRWMLGLAAMAVASACEPVEDVGPLLDELEAVQAQVREVVAGQVTAAEEAFAAAVRAKDAADEHTRELVRGAWRPGIEDESAAARLVAIRAGGTRTMAEREHDRMEAVETSMRSRHSDGMRRLREAYVDGTWDLIADASPRSIVMGALRDAEEELRRVEAGCSPLPQPDDDCVVEVAGDE